MQGEPGVEARNFAGVGAKASAGWSIPYGNHDLPS